MLNFIGGLIDRTRDLGGNYLWGLVIFALMMKLVFYIVYKDYYRSIGIGEMLREDMDALRKKHRNNEKKANEEITNLLMRNRYGMFGSAFLFLIEGFLTLVVGLTLREPLLHTSAASLDEFVVYEVALHTSPLSAMTQKYLSINSAMSMFIVVMVMVLQIVHDTYMENRRVVEQDKIDHVIWVILALMCLILPTGAGVFMLTFKLVNMLLYLYFSHKKYTKLATDRVAKGSSQKTGSKTPAKSGSDPNTAQNKKAK